MTTDSDLGSVNSLIPSPSGLKGISSSSKNMVTMPVEYDPANANRVLVDKAKAKQVWTALKNDRAIPAMRTTENSAAGVRGCDAEGANAKAR